MVIWGIYNNVKWPENIVGKLFCVLQAFQSQCLLFNTYEEEAIKILYKMIKERKNIYGEYLLVAFNLLSYFMVKYKNNNKISKTQLVEVIQENILYFKEYRVDMDIFFMECIKYLIFNNIIDNEDLQLKDDMFDSDKTGKLIFIQDDYFTNSIFNAVPEHDIIQSKYGPLKRKQPKIGRNDPCFCGSGKKYKKCCEGKNESIYMEMNYQEELSDTAIQEQKQIESMNALELENLDFSVLEFNQLDACFQKAMTFNNFELAYKIIKFIRRLCEDTDGIIPIEETNIHDGKKQIFDNSFDDIVYEYIMEFERVGRYDYIKKIIELYFSSENKITMQSQLYIALADNDMAKIMELIEKIAFSGIVNVNELVDLFYNIYLDFPGLAVMIFRSVIAASPDRQFDIFVMIESIEKLMFLNNVKMENEPSIDNYYKLMGKNENDQKTMRKVEEMRKALEENKLAKQEIQKQKAIIKGLNDELKKINERKEAQISSQNAIIETKKSSSGNNELINSLIKQIAQSKEKIVQYKNIIDEKQQNMKDLRGEFIKKCQNSNEEKEKTKEIELDHEEEFFEELDYTSLISKKIILPVYEKTFEKNIGNVPDNISKKALKAITDFILGDMSVLKQTKAIKSKINYFSIRVTIHYRLLFEYVPERQLNVRYLIHRKDLEKILMNL